MPTEKPAAARDISSHCVPRRQDIRRAIMLIGRLDETTTITRQLLRDFKYLELKIMDLPSRKISVSI